MRKKANEMKSKIKSKTKDKTNPISTKSKRKKKHEILLSISKSQIITNITYTI